MNRVTSTFHRGPSLRIGTLLCEGQAPRAPRLRALSCEGQAPRAPRLRALAVLVTAFAGMTAWAQMGCEEVPEARRAQCEKVMDCMTIEDADVRRACINAAQREAVQESPPSQQTVQPERVQQPVERVSSEEREAPPIVQERTIRPHASDGAQGTTEARGANGRNPTASAPASGQGRAARAIACATGQLHGRGHAHPPVRTRPSSDRPRQPLRVLRRPGRPGAPESRAVGRGREGEIAHPIGSHMAAHRPVTTPHRRVSRPLRARRHR